MSKVARGYAVLYKFGSPVIETVSGTERAAKVNWLVVNGTLVTRVWSDGMISEAFSKLAEPHGFRVARVEVREVQ